MDTLKYCVEITPNSEVGSVKRKNKYRPVCRDNNCFKRPSFNYPDKKTGIYCSDHKNINMINVNVKSCRHFNCVTTPGFNYEGHKQALFCNIHKNINMVDVRMRLKCIRDGCQTIPSFNYEGEIKGLYCGIHKNTNMINVIKKNKCIQNGCMKTPHFNYEGEIQGCACKSHKLKTMIDVVSKKCIHKKCKIRPNFNILGKKGGLYCNLHKLDNMDDVINKKCIQSFCERMPHFNYENEKRGLYCNRHKLVTMINVLEKRRCFQDDCQTVPSFNYEGKKGGLYCSIHKSDIMVNVVSKTCKTYLCPTTANKKYDGYCLYCYMNTFPDNPISRNYKTKERTVVEFVYSLNTELSWVSDKRVMDGCSRRRPDLFLDLGYQIIIVEIDENQHTNYDCSCENKRLMELSQDVNHRPIVFIRFNPDEYFDKNGKNITSCWGNNKNGINVIKKSKINEWSNRLKTLEQQINYWIIPENMTDKTLEIIQLFYDENMV